jgi:SNF2 family DNA or RNA helicase
MNRSNAKKQATSSLMAKAPPPACTQQPKPSPWFEKLYDEQKKAVEFIETRPATALFCKAGTGKTFISLAVLERTDWHVALIVAPLTSLGITWRPKLLTLTNCRILGSAQELVSALKTPGRVHTRLIVLTNPEALRTMLKRMSKIAERIDIVIWDESQNIKNRSSANSRIARRLRFVPRRIALSGTPIDTGQIDIWAQMRFVDHTVFGENWQDFANMYCYKSGWMGKEWMFNPHKADDFLTALKDHVFRLDDKFLGLKPMTVTPVPVMLLGQQRVIYETMERDNLVRVDGVDIVANNAGARDVKLSQITGGAVLDEDGGRHATGRAKQRKLLHLLRTTQSEWPLVIFCQFLHEIDIILDMFEHEPYKIAVIKGQVKERDRTTIVADFQRGQYDVLICQVRTGGESIDLTRASTLIMYSMSYSYINFEQILRRLQRGGQTRAVRVYVLYCINSVDADKLQLVQQKSETSSGVLTHFEE